MRHSEAEQHDVIILSLYLNALLRSIHGLGSLQGAAPYHSAGYIPIPPVVDPGS